MAFSAVGNCTNCGRPENVLRGIQCAAMMKVISCNATFTGNPMEVPKSSLNAFTLGRRGNRIYI